MIDADLVDFHCHLDLHRDMDAAFKRCDARRCITFTVTTTPKAFARNAEYAKRTTYVKAALGLHPQLVSKRAAEITLFDELSKKTRFIGEIGLDATRAHYPSFDKQQEVFDHILRTCAAQGEKVISVHSARCAKKVLDGIERSGANENCKVVLHWFSAGASEIRRAVDLGCWFSVNERMMDAKSGKNLIALAPKERVLSETDAPFLQKGGEDIYAGDVYGVINALAGEYKMSEQDVKAELVQNSIEILK